MNKLALYSYLIGSLSFWQKVGPKSLAWKKLKREGENPTPPKWEARDDANELKLFDIIIRTSGTDTILTRWSYFPPKKAC